MANNFVHSHCHTEYSLNDSKMNVKTLVQKAKESGAYAVALTDHGTLMGIEAFRKACKDEGIKPLLGVEAYYEGGYGKSHLVLIAKNYRGFQAIMKAISKANHNIDKVGAPLITKDDLVHYFGKDGIGYGNVVATSACAGGVLAKVYFQNEDTQKKIDKLNKNLSKLPSSTDKNYSSLCKEIEDVENQLEDLKEEISRLDTLSKKKYIMRENRLKKLEGSEYEAEKAAIEKEKSESDFALTKIVEIRNERASVSKRKTALNKEKSDFEDKFIKRSEIENEITVLESQLKDKSSIMKEIQKELDFFKKVFPDFYIELQNHRIPMEVEVYPVLAELAKKTSTPVVVANDIHTPDNSPESLRGRQIMQSLRFNTYQEIQTGDDELYVKTRDELKSILSEILPLDIIEEGFENICKIADMCDVIYPEEDNFPKFKCPEGKTSKEYLRELAEQGISWRYPNGEWTTAHQERLNYELGIIDQLGFNDYHLVVRDFLQYGRLLGQLKDLPEGVPTMEELEAMPKDFPKGMSVGPGRGSAVGSLACYLLGITAIDPLKYDLIFERFLNVERVSMPDIDSDFRSDVREKVIAYCIQKYGQNAVCGIVAPSTQQEKDSIRNCARILSSQKYNDTSVLLKLGDEIAKAFGADESFDTLREKFATHQQKDDAIQILNDAELVCGTLTNVSKHAAGVVISGSPSVTDYLPLLYVKGKDAFVSQYDKVFVEKLKCLKMDFLGLRNIGIIDDTLRMIQQHYNEELDVEKLPFKEKVFKEIFQSGKTNSVFQFESPGMKKMLIDFKPDSFEDIILLVAAYRPGPLQYLPEIIESKHSGKANKYIIPELKPILDTTYGKPIYQEQVMQIFNKCAGFTLGEADNIRRLMSKKDIKGFSEYKGKFIAGIVEKGAMQEEAEKLWEELLKFSEYAFNKSHATAYALVAYITAYLKCYYTKEFLCAVANYTPLDSIESVIKDCDLFDIKLRIPDINESQENFTVVGNSILYGLGKVKEVGKDGERLVSCRNDFSSFSSVADFFVKTHCGKSTAEYLTMAGAFEKFAPNRKALYDVLPEYLEFDKKVKAKEKKIEEFEMKLSEDGLKEKDKEKYEKSLESYKKSLQDLISSINALSFDKTEESVIQKLDYEKIALGAPVSASYLDGYSTPEENGCIPLAFIKEGAKSTVMGFVSDLRITKKKSNNKDMAFFMIEDQTGIIKASVFDVSYSKFGSLIKENVVLKITGNIKKDTYNDTDSYNIVADKIEVVEPNKKPVIIYIEDEFEWVNKILPILPLYRSKVGHKVKVFDISDGLYRNAYYAIKDSEKDTFGDRELTVSLDILEDERIKTQY